MEEVKLGYVESRFADIIWQNEPLTSGELVKLCREKLEWKKSTTYTVLKKLCEKGIFQNEHSQVTSLITKDEYMTLRSEQFVDDTFDGSLPKFLSAFMRRKKLTAKQISEIQSFIDNYKE